ncbi:PTS mannose/fructose/sorbose transporter subunit IIB [Lachnospiraceae bacterium oral taxon 500]|nr:PTS mannose/fructose/sorbose transporter subunit IIB [Lachnospiraceae bacterium oral taxon 500]
MQINHMRIDDRLIHGQIVTAWISDSKANTIMVADDKAAKDSLQQTMLKFAVPSGIKLIINSIEDAAKTLNDPLIKEAVLLIVRNPKCAYELLLKGVSVQSVNVGNISNSKSEKGRKKLLQFIFVEPEDVEYLKKIYDMGIKLDVRAIPNDKSIDGMDLLTKNGL